MSAAPRRPADDLARDGKFISSSSGRFWLRGVTVDAGSRDAQACIDRAVELGANCIRVREVPDRGLLHRAAGYGLRVVVDLGLDSGMAPARRPLEYSTSHIAGIAAELGEHPVVAGITLSSSPSTSRGIGGCRSRERRLRDAADACRASAPGILVGYCDPDLEESASPPGFDFDCYDLPVSPDGDPTTVIAALHARGGDRPLLVGIRADAGRPEQLANLLMEAGRSGAAGICVEFSEEGDDVAARDVVRRHLMTDIGATREDWPMISVVVCAYQAAGVLDRCLSGVAAIRYPNFETIVVDDGSADRTAEIAQSHGVRLVAAGRMGLSGARNLGLQAARGEIVAYLDSDAWPDPDWLTFLSFAFDSAEVGAAGGPNLVPADDPFVAQCVSRAAGGPSPVLLKGNRAEIVPGCNLALRADVLRAIGGFDTIYRSAGDDVDICWKVREAGHEIAYHHGAVVWHQRRPTIRAAWRQQRGYGRAEADLAQNHPRRFSRLGVPVLSGSVHGPNVPGWRAETASGGSHAGPSRLGIPRVRRRHVLMLVIASSVLGIWRRWALILPALVSSAVILGHLGHGMRTARAERLEPPLRHGLVIGFLNLTLPFPRTFGRLKALLARPRAGQRR